MVRCCAILVTSAASLCGLGLTSSSAATNATGANASCCAECPPECCPCECCPCGGEAAAPTQSAPAASSCCAGVACCTK